MGKYIVYKTTNLLNNHYYIGVHKTQNVEEFDGYYGSGTYFKLALEHYGEKNFKRETLFVYDTEIEMYNKEKELVTKKYLSNENNYNLALGGKNRNSVDLDSSRASYNKWKSYMKLMGKVGSRKIKLEIYLGAFILPSKNIEYFIHKFKEEYSFSFVYLDILRQILNNYALDNTFTFYNPKKHRVYPAEKFQLLLTSEMYTNLTGVHINSYRKAIKALREIGVLKKKFLKNGRVTRYFVDTVICWELYSQWVKEDTKNARWFNTATQFEINTLTNLFKMQEFKNYTSFKMTKPYKSTKKDTREELLPANAFEIPYGDLEVKHG